MKEFYFTKHHHTHAILCQNPVHGNNKSSKIVDLQDLEIEISASRSIVRKMDVRIRTKTRPAATTAPIKPPERALWKAALPSGV